MKINTPYSDPALNLALDTISIGKQAIVFANTKRSAEKIAEEIAKKTKLRDLTGMAGKATSDISPPTKQCKRLAGCLEKKVAFHHAGLTSGQRGLVEDNFKNGNIKIVAATTTMAAGLDMPAFRVIIRDLKRFGLHGLQYIPVIEYLQMSGRAGRPRYDSKGESIIVCSSEENRSEVEELYINGEPEPIYSKLAAEPVLRTYVLSLIASGFISSEKSILDFFMKTFWAHQYSNTTALNSSLRKALEQLIGWKLLESSYKGDFRAASELGKEAYSATILGKRVSELYIDPLTANYLCEMLLRAPKEVHSFALLHVVSSALEMRPLLKVRSKEFDIIQEMLVKYGDSLLDKEPSIYEAEYDKFQDSIKTAMLLHEWIEEKGEENLLEEFGIRPGETRAKVEIADWILYCMEEIARIMKMMHLLPALKKLRLRLKYGVKEELIPLIRLRNIGRARARRLFNSGIKDVGEVRTAELSRLSLIVGRAVAEDIKKQVDGSVIEEKRQASLADYK